MGELVGSLPGGLARYRPRLRYLLLDEGRYSDLERDPMKNLTAAVFRLENSRTPEDLLAVLEALLGWLDSPGQTGLRRDFATWLQRVVLRRSLPKTYFPEVAELREVHNSRAYRASSRS